ncbi:MAG: hypothetical protein Q8O44_00505 [Syntrophales bacterium]|nr:hypothetical protein [Syntrophales bacterium]
MKKNLAIMLAVALTVMPFWLGCGGGSENKNEDSINLVGTWTGTLSGSGGTESLTMILNADHTMTAQGSNVFYSQLYGTWALSGSQFTGNASSGNLSINFTNASVSGNAMSGTWSGNAGTSGSFSVTKSY